MVAAAERRCPLSDLAWLSLASISVNSEDVVGTTHSVGSDRNKKGHTTKYMRIIVFLHSYRQLGLLIYKKTFLHVAVRGFKPII